MKENQKIYVFVPIFMMIKISLEVLSKLKAEVSLYYNQALFNLTHLKYVSVYALLIFVK